MNHSASAQDCKTALAAALPAFALSATSWNASNTRRVFFNASAAKPASSALSRSSTSGATL